eukprot:7383724-Prymnesium_polylepis.1
MDVGGLNGTCCWQLPRREASSRRNIDALRSSPAATSTSSCAACNAAGEHSPAAEKFMPNALAVRPLA